MSAVQIYKDQLRLLINDPIVRNTLTYDGVTAGTIKIEDNYDITLGRSSKGWVNFLFQSTYRISFFEIATKIAGVYVGKINKEQTTKILNEIIERCINENRKEEVIDLLFMYAKLFVKDSILKSQYIQTEDIDNFAKDPRLRQYTGEAYINLGGESMPVILTANFKNLT